MEYRVLHLEKESVLIVGDGEPMTIEKIEGSPELDIPGLYIIDGRPYESIEDYIYNDEKSIKNV